MKAIDTLTRLKQKKELLDSRIQKLEAAQKTKERKSDTRRKILVGAHYLEKATQEKAFEEELKNAMDKFLVRDSDRALFNLVPKS
jgi:hypothetical protein